MRVAPLFLTLGLVFGLPACDSGGDGGDSDTHDTHTSHGTDGDTGDPDTMVMWDTDNPPASITADTDTPVMFVVHTAGELHIAEIRACMGEVAACGDGDMTSFDESFSGTSDDGHMYMATVNLAAGTWTLVPYAHVGPDPHLGPPTTVTVE